MQRINELVLKVAQRLNRSGKYKGVKHFLDEVLNNPDNPYKKYVDLTMMFLIVTSVAILVYEVRNPVPEWMDYYDIYLVSFIFLIEYILRLWVHTDFYRLVVEEAKKAKFIGVDYSLKAPLTKAIKKTVAFIFTPAMIIDFLAILPAYRELRILRVFVLFRVFKLLRYTKSINQFIEVLHNKRFELLTLLFLLLFVMVTAGIAIYVFEEHINPEIETIFDAFYWSLVTISTVGFGDIAPVTHEGRVVSMIIIVIGITMLSFATSVIVSAFSEKLTEIKENRIIELVNKNDEFLIICGYGQMTKMFLRQRRKGDTSYIIIEKDYDRFRQAVKDGHNAIQEDASRHDTLVKFNIQYSQITILCLLNSDIENIYISLNAKSISKHIKVIARATETSMIQKFKKAGADEILLPTRIANIMMQTAISKPHLYKAAHAILTGKDIAVLDEVTVYHDDVLEGKEIGNIDFRKMRIMLMAVEKRKSGEMIFNPSSHMVLEAGDVLVLMGHRMGLDYFKEYTQEIVA